MTTRDYADLYRKGRLILDERPDALDAARARRNQALLAGLSWWEKVTLIVRGPKNTAKSPQRR
jgi:hypothetical protein